MLISEAFYSYAQDVIIFRNQSAKTEENHYIAMKSLINYLGDIEIEDLEFAQVRDWKLSLEKRHLGPETVRSYLIKLRVVLGYLRKQGKNCLDPEQIPLPKRHATVPKILCAEEITRLIAAAGASTSNTRLYRLRNQAIISLLYSTGLRVSELCALNISDIEKDYFTVIGKGGKDRICFIDRRSRDLLNRYLSLRLRGHDPELTDKILRFCETERTSEEIMDHLNRFNNSTNRKKYIAPLLESGCLEKRMKIVYTPNKNYNEHYNLIYYHTVSYDINPSDGDNHTALFLSGINKTRIKANTVQEIFQHVRKAAGFDWPVHPHTLRHSFATNMHLNGAPLFAVKEMMGHASLETTSIYLHIWDEQLAETHKKYHTI